MVKKYVLVCLVSVAALLLAPLSEAAGIQVSSYNDRYFSYNGTETLLIGASGDYLPHVSHTRTDWVSYSTYQSFVNALQSANLNKMRLWVGLNHSPGTELGSGSPWPHEQPFTYNSSTGKWDLDSFDGTYFQQLKNVVSYCKQKGVIVEVTLFDPWSGSETTGPWYPANNTDNIGFTARRYFTTFDSATGHNLSANQAAFAKQIQLVEKVVSELKNYDNVYWEISNEPDINANSGVGTETVAWHKQILAVIHDKEDSLGVARKPVGVELHKIENLIALTCPPGSIFCIDLGTGNPTVFDVVNGHYVDQADTSRRSALEILRHQNLREVHSFNEGKIYPGQVTRAGVRAEAWEFILNGGGAYDQLHYNWSSGGTVRADLQKLRKFMQGNTLNETAFLRSAKADTSWCGNLPAYGSTQGSSKIYYSGMKYDGQDYRLYIHHSTISTTGGFGYYIPKFVTNGYQNTVQLSLGPTTKSFHYQWINPATGATITGAEGDINWIAGGQPVTVASPQYSFDIALQVKAN